MGSTEVAHLLEHVTIELMAQTGLGGDVSCGRTWEVTGEPRTYDVQLACPDDVLVASALSSAAWILQWAYSGGADPKPDVAAIVSGIRELVENAEQIAERAGRREPRVRRCRRRPRGGRRRALRRHRRRAGGGAADGCRSRRGRGIAPRLGIIANNERPTTSTRACAGAKGGSYEQGCSWICREASLVRPWVPSPASCWPPVPVRRAAPWLPTP